MKSNDIKLRQICLIFLGLMPVNKIKMLPSILAGYAYEQLYIPMIINFAFDILTLLVFIVLSNKFPNQTIFSIIERQFSRKTAQFIYFLYGAFFMLKGFLPIIEQKYYVDNTLYEVFPNIISFFPLLALSAYASIKGLKVLGRTADISIWFTSLGLILAIFLSVAIADFSNILPIFRLPSLKCLDASYSTVVWYSESAYMLLFLGHFKEEKHKTLKLMLSYGGMSILLVGFVILFYSVFGSIAPSQNFAVSNMTIYFAKIINVGRFDYLAVFLLLFSGVFGICLPIYFATKCFERAFNASKAFIPSICVNVIYLILLILLESKFYSLLAFVKSYLNWYFIVMAYIVPVLFLIFFKKEKKCKSLNHA